MADKIKDFFSKKIKDAKFKMAGTGRKLNEDPNKDISGCSSVSDSGPRLEPSKEARMAGMAALQRFQTTKEPNNAFSVKKIAKKIVEAEETVGKPTELTENQPDQPICSNEQPFQNLSKERDRVCFTCPLIGPDVLSKQEWRSKIKLYIEEILQSNNDPSYIVLLIKSVNDSEKVEFAVEKLKLCLRNILEYPDDEKFKKIKATNPLFKDKILPVEGCELFLLSAGFDRQTIDDLDYFIYPYSEPQITVLTEFIDALSITECIKLTLDRNLKVSNTSNHSDNTESDAFFALTKEEVKMEAFKRREAIEDMQILKTKAMREKEFNKPVYDYTVIKIKFPNGIFIQGTFAVCETISDVRQFIMDNLIRKSENFSLSTGLGKSIDDNNKSLMEEHLVPSALLHFEWLGSESCNLYLCEETLALMS